MAASGVAVITLEDGPDRDGTPALLDALDAAGAQATFFLLGEQLMRAPRLGGLIRDRGHEIALHGYAHTAHDALHPGQTRDDIARGLGTVEAATAVRARFYRPPFGMFTDASYEACEALELERVVWSAEAADELGEGSIVRLHESAAYDGPGEAARAIAALAGRAGEQGLELVTLGEALSRE